LRLVDAHRFTDAEPTLQEIQKAHPDDAMVKLGLGECALGMGRLDESGTLFASLADDPTYRPKALQGLGIALVRRGDAQTATAALEQATAMEPNLWRAWNGLGQAYDIQHMWDASKHAYEHALQNTPDAGIIYNNRGMSLLAQERYDDALKAFDQARIADPTLAAVETNRQLTLALQQRFPEATFATRPEEKAKLLNNAGYVALMKGDYDRAEQLFVQAAETSPTYYAQAHNNLQVLEQVRAKSQGNHS
jgi:Flp pilus assembly protein TadD